MSDNKGTFGSITISRDGISASKFTRKGLKQAMEQLIDEHQEFAEQARWGEEQLEAKNERIFELEGRLEAKERLLEEWGVDRERLVNKISELEMNIAGLKRNLDDWRGDAQEWQDLMGRLGGNDTWTAQDVESHYQMSVKGEREQGRVTLNGQGFTVSRATVPRVVTADELKPGQWIAVAFRGDPAKWVTGRVFRDHQINGYGIGRGAQRRDVLPTATIVLLEDAPAEEPEPVKVGDTISTVEELDGLPVTTVVRGKRGDALVKALGYWWLTSSENAWASEELEHFAPFTVLYLPEEDA